MTKICISKCKYRDEKSPAGLVLSSLPNIKPEDIKSGTSPNAKQRTDLSQVQISEFCGYFPMVKCQLLGLALTDHKIITQLEHGYNKVGKPQKCIPIAFPQMTLSFDTDLDLDLSI